MYVVTGGAGFIGSNILAALEERGYEDLVAVDRLRDGNKWRNVAHRELSDIVEPVRVFEFLERHRQKIKAVFHMGAVSSTMEKEPIRFNKQFDYPMALLRWCTTVSG